MDPTIMILLALGLLAGIIAGIFGLGGGILFTPVLFVFFSEAGVENPVVLTIGSSLFCTFIASVGSSVRQFYQHNFFWAEGIKVGLLGATGVTAGKFIVTSSFYSQQVFAIFFSLLLVYVSFLFFQRGRKNTKSIYLNKELITWKQSGIAGGVGGFVAALAGIGGGGVMVPILNLYYKQPFKKVVSISSLAIVMISLSGWMQLTFTDVDQSLTAYTVGSVDFGAALPLSIGGLAGGFLGALLNLKINRRYLQFAFAVLAVGMSIKLIAEVF